LAIEPDNVEALIGCAAADVNELIRFEAAERLTVLASAEASLSRALSIAPDSARRTLILELCQEFLQSPRTGRS
jgi:hypothetical protein